MSYRYKALVVVSKFYRKFGYFVFTVVACDLLFINFHIRNIITYSFLAAFFGLIWVS